MTFHSMRRAAAFVVACALAGCSGASQSFVPAGAPSSTQSRANVPGSTLSATDAGAHASSPSATVATKAGPGTLIICPPGTNLSPAATASAATPALTPIACTSTTPPPTGNPCVIGCNPGPPNPGPCGDIAQGAQRNAVPGQPHSATPCGPTGPVAYSGKPQNGEKCDGSQFEIGSPIVPATQNSANVTYYVDNIANVWQNGVIVAVEYRATTPSAAGTEYYFMQETNNGASINFGASIGVSFGPVNIGVSGGESSDMTSPVQWFFPSTARLPAASTQSSCWPSYPVAA